MTGSDGTFRLRRASAEEFAGVQHAEPVDSATLRAAGEIVERVRTEGSAAVREYAERFGERAPGEVLVLGRDAMHAALDDVTAEERGLLERAAGRIKAFARAQREAVREVDVAIPGGRAGHTVECVEAAGCYAPAGRHPLPSSVLMTAVTARVAGCARVVVASPGAHPTMLAAAAIADADEFLAVGGAHAIAAMAFGIESLPAVDVVVGPGNRWVTAAKRVVSGAVGIDMLAGPSEVLVIADESADAALVAADLLAQAEHDPDARVVLVSTCEALVLAVEEEVGRQGPALATWETASASLRAALCCVVGSIEEACVVADRVGTEHLQIVTRDADEVAQRIRHAGAVFVGAGAGVVLGDFGAGPNHTLPTGGTARYSAGLSVMHFLRMRTWLRMDDLAAAEPIVRDAMALAALEGLPAHGAAAAARMTAARRTAS